MAYCMTCGQRVAFGGRRYLRKMSRLQTLIAQLHLAHHEADRDKTQTPPEIRSALLDVKPLLKRLVTEGGELTADLHEAAHHRVFVIDDDRVRDWESKAERVLFELLAALELHTE